MRRALSAVVILVAAALALAYAAYRRDIDREFERVSTGSRIAQTPCGPIEYTSTGEGLPLLVVHGAGGGYDQIGTDLVGSGFRMIAVSRFGYLRTPLPTDASAAAQADAHACLLDALGIRRAVVFGVSAGAPSSMQFALRHPERCAGLVLMVPATYVPRPGGGPSVTPPPGIVFLFDTALKSDFFFWAAIRLARKTMIGSILGTPPEVVEKADADEQARVAQLLDRILPVSRRRLGLENDAAVVGALSRYELERIRAPTLVISVADDRYGTYEPARYTAEHIPGARFVGYETGGHLWVGHHKETLAEVAKFLAGIKAD